MSNFSRDRALVEEKISYFQLLSNKKKQNDCLYRSCNTKWFSFAMQLLIIPGKFYSFMMWEGTLNLLKDFAPRKKCGNPNFFLF